MSSTGLGVFLAVGFSAAGANEGSASSIAGIGEMETFSLWLLDNTGCVLPLLLLET